jgi:RNA recognition motif-containing protein
MGNSDRQPLRKIFVGNLSDNATDWDLRCLFCMYGLVVEAHVSRDRVTHAKKKFGFVTYNYPQEAMNMLILRPGKLRPESGIYFWQKLTDGSSQLISQSELCWGGRIPMEAQKE